MLEELRISNLGVIAEAAVALAPGLNVLTGETGAGKTMVVTALQLLVGGRGDAGLVRAGADQAVVESLWSPVPDEMARWVAHETGSDDVLGDAVVRRAISASGRSRVRIAGALAAVGALGEALAPAVEIHAQDSHRRLLAPASQRDLLDAWAGDEHLGVVAEHAAAHVAHQRAEARRQDLRTGATQRARELDHLEREVAEIDRVGLTAADDTLDQLVDELAHAEELAFGFHAAAEGLGPDGAGDGLGIALEALRRLPTETTASAALQPRVDEVVALVADLAEDLRVAGEAIETDPAELDRVQARLSTVRGLCRRFGPEPSDVLVHRDRAAERIEELRTLSLDEQDIDDEVRRTAVAVERTAARVTAGRRGAAASLAAAVHPHLADLALAHATFEVAVEPGPMGPTGQDRIVFLLAPNPGQAAVGLGDAASGGERSRVALALEVTLAGLTDAAVLVFDEVDAGVGGATAMKVGEKLASLAASGRQVLCVTHLAQLAAWADHHMVVDKQVADGTTRSVVTSVAEADRPAELARMLGGDTTEVARAHATQLLAAARPSSGR